MSDELPNVPGLSERWGQAVLHCPYCHGWEVRGKRLGVLAVAPGSVHQIQLVRQWSDSLVVLGSALGPLDESMRRRLASRSIEVVDHDVVKITGSAGALDIHLSNGDLLNLDALFTGGRPHPHDEFLAPIDLARTETPMGSFIHVNETWRTSHPRVWAVGNVVDPAATVPVAIGAGAQAVIALNMALVAEDFDLAVSSASP